MRIYFFLNKDCVTTFSCAGDFIGWIINVLFGWRKEVNWCGVGYAIEHSFIASNTEFLTEFYKNCVSVETAVRAEKDAINLVGFQSKATEWDRKIN